MLCSRVLIHTHLLCCCLVQVKVDKKAVLTALGGTCSESDFMMVVESFYVHCSHMIGPPKPKPVRKSVLCLSLSATLWPVDGSHFCFVAFACCIDRRSRPPKIAKAVVKGKRKKTEGTGQKRWSVSRAAESGVWRVHRRTKRVTHAPERRSTPPPPSTSLSSIWTRLRRYSTAYLRFVCVSVCLFGVFTLNPPLLPASEPRVACKPQSECSARARGMAA